MKKIQFSILFLLCCTALQARSTKKKHTLQRFYYKDSIVSMEKWFGENHQLDSLRTYYVSGAIDEAFYYQKNKFHGACKKYNADGTLAVVWNFEKGTLLTSTNYKLAYTQKNKKKILRYFKQLQSIDSLNRANPKINKYKYRRTQLFHRLNYKILAVHGFKYFESYLEKTRDKGNKKTAKILSNTYDALGSLYASYEMDNLAIEYKFKAIISAPNESRLYHNLGSYLVKNKEYRLGIYYLEEAIKIHPKHGFAHWLLGIAYSDLDMPELALEKIQVAFQREEGIKKRNTGRSERDLRTTRGYIYHQLGDDSSAFEDLDKALDANDKNSYAYRNLGVIYFKQGNFDAACANFSLAKELHYTQAHDQYDLAAYISKSCTIEKETETEQPTISQMPFVWPNPATSFIKIENYTYENFPYTIFSYNGKIVQEGIADRKTIGLENIAQGTYVLKINLAEAPQQFKIIKLNN